MKQNELTLRPVEDRDLDLLASWLNKEYILTWYQDAEEWLAEIKGRHGSYSWLHHFIVMYGGTPIGFCQYYDCYDANALEDWYQVTEPHDTFSIDYLIGDEAYLGKGYGKSIIKLLIDTIRQTGQAKQIIVNPEAENHASNHVLLANGYVFDDKKRYYIKRLN